ncbi:DUF6695 family protein [Bizionia arctica]|uniref:Uncharacterized protein n=1 Tax=Bizionia arctica TaxID=1495645 RepID=A0A917GDZ8_9FLAO|nr:DUF6695 family protein [Bizionia arctica]GGG41207.1 hypothetical protein GCM10010976_11000 [Bizionia arctica]
MDNSGIIITLGYPETVVMISDEWYVNYLHYLGIGTKNYVRAGHAALVLIDKKTGFLEYYDFGRYITSSSNGRVRSKDTDCELEFPMVAKIGNENILNLNDILEFLSTNPELTHGKGTMYASVNNEINYFEAKKYILELQDKQQVRYSAFITGASNCARFVTDALIASVTNNSIKKRLRRSKRFTPSTVGNVLIAALNSKVYQVDETGKFLDNKLSIRAINKTCFLDKLVNHKPDFEGTLLPKALDHVHEFAQWLPGIGSGAWFELHETEILHEYVFRRISPYGNVDIHAIFAVNDTSFAFGDGFTFMHNSTCKSLHIKQDEKTYIFNRI